MDYLLDKALEELERAKNTIYLSVTVNVILFCVIFIIIVKVVTL